MAVKYECPKCHRRFAEWGAEKLGFKCPLDDRCPAGAVGEEITLLRLGLKDDGTPPKATLRKKPKVVAEPAISTSDDDIEDSATLPGDDDNLDIDDEDVEEGDEDEEEEVVVGAVGKKKAIASDDADDSGIIGDDDTGNADETADGDDALGIEED